jgi:Tol biopolymer transport system component
MHLCRHQSKIRRLESRGSVALLALLGAVLFGLPDDALAAFPGVNGKIAFSATGGGTDYEIYTMNSDGTGITAITNNSTDDYSPRWSPSGRKIAFASTRDGDPEIYLMNADGTGQTRVTTNPAFDFQPAWSPDASKLAFVSNRDGNDEIYVMNTDGGGETTLTSDPADDYDPVWSPDGTKIAFVRAGQNIYTMNPDGTGVTSVPSGVQHGCAESTSQAQFDPEWSPDGQSLAFGDYESDPTCTGSYWYSINTIKPNGTNELTVFSEEQGGYAASPAWSPDGTKIAYLCSDVYLCVSGTYYGQVGQYDMDWQPIAPPGYARPRAATPTTVKLVPAYEPCTSPNGTHGAPLASGSCSPQAQASDYLTVGTFDANAAGSNSVSYVQFRAICNPPAPNPVPPCTDPGDQTDVELTASITDVRNTGDLSDYTGELRALIDLRITDRLNGLTGFLPATVADTPFGFNLTCLPTASDSIGSACSAATTADAVMPGIAREDKRAVWQLGQVQVYDGGADGDADTAGDNTLFATQGLFAP